MSIPAPRRSLALSTALAAALVLSAAAPVAGADPAAGGDVAVPTAMPGARIMVTYQDSTSFGRGGQGVTGARLALTTPAIRMKVFEVGAGDEQRVMRQLAAQAGVDTIESEVQVESTVTPNDPMWRSSVMWAHDRVGLRSAWNQTRGSARVTIAILDSGLEWHPEFAKRIVGGWDFVEGDSTTNDPRGHGTMSAGAAAARGNNGIGVAGGCWECRIMPVRVLDQNGTGYAASVIRGIIWATDRGADVISMSFGGFAPSAAMADAIAYARARDVVVLASAGNDGESLPFYPGALPGVIGVAASDTSNRAYGWSNRGRPFELAAPGCFYTTRTGKGYINFCGTSASTPLVAGIVGLMRSARPDLPGYMIERALLATAKPLGYVSHGLPDANRALLAARAMTAPPRKGITQAWAESGGTVVIEAERANERIGRETVDWIDGTIKPGFAGPGYVAAWADKGYFRGTGYATNSAELRYHVQFTTPGVYSVWLRTWAPDAGGDSVHVGVNGKPLAATDRMSTGKHRYWAWTRSTMDGPLARIRITKSGVHTINVWVREDGFRFDRIVISQALVPVGAGPAESNRIDIPKP